MTRKFGTAAQKCALIALAMLVAEELDVALDAVRLIEAGHDAIYGNVAMFTGALAVRPGDRLAVLSAGAYGMAMASNYNTRPRAPEVLVDGSDFRVIRRRETLDDLWRLEL